MCLVTLDILCCLKNGIVGFWVCSWVLGLWLVWWLVVLHLVPEIKAFC